MLPSVCVVVVEVVVFWACVSGEGKEDVGGSEERGGEGLRRAVKSTADEERCIRANGILCSPKRWSLIVG
jgi:hypothetical protein